MTEVAEPEVFGGRLRVADPVTLADRPGLPAIGLGLGNVWAVDPARTRLAVVGHPTWEAEGGGMLRIIDLESWRVTEHDLDLGWLTSLAFDPEGEALYWSEQSQQPEPLLFQRFHLATAELTNLPASIDPWAWDRPVQPLSADRLAVFGVSPTEQGQTQGWPRLLLLDFAGQRVIADVTLEGMAAGFQRLDIEGEPQDAREDYPGVAWDLENRLLYVTHPEDDEVTVVDLDTGQLKIRETVATPSPFLERLAQWLVPTAQAKLSEGTIERVTLSPDGSRLYVTGERQEASGSATEWVYQTLPLGLQVIATEDLTEAAHLDLPATELILTPDGNRLLLFGGVSRAAHDQEWTNDWFSVRVLDTTSLEVLAEFQSEGTLRVLGTSPDSRYAYVSEQRQNKPQVLRALDLERMALVSERLFRLGTVYLGGFLEGVLLVEYPDD
jgi:hypothetical protein